MSIRVEWVVMSRNQPRLEGAHLGSKRPPWQHGPNRRACKTGTPHENLRSRIVTFDRTPRRDRMADMILGAIIAGGAARCFGSDKALAAPGGRRLIDQIGSGAGRERWG